MQNELNSLIQMAEKSLIPVGVYQHYKGQRYKVFGTARHSEEEQTMVIYQTLYGDFSFWVRPLEMFTEKIQRDGNWVKRFEFINTAQN